MEQLQADLCIKGGTVLTVDQERRVIPDGVVLTTGDRITAVGKSSELKDSYQAERTINADGMLVIPGLINAHSHLAMTLFRGFVEDLVLQKWLEKVWKYELSALDAEAVRAGSKLALAEMIKGGITCAHDMYWHYDQTIELAEEIGFRLLSGPPITRLGDPDFDEMFRKAEDTLAWIDDLAYVHPVLQTHSTYTTNSLMMETVREFKEKYQVSFTTHASENQAEVDDVREMYQRSPIQVLHDHQLLDGSTVLAHCVKVTEEEIELLYEMGTHVAHCPESNLKLGSGIAPIAAMLETGINVCLGTDGAASNNDLDILSEIRTAALLQKGAHHNPELLTTEQALDMITINGAKAYHLDSLIGSLEVGKKADLVLVDFDQTHLTPNFDPCANLIYSAVKSDVDTVIIDGKIHLESGNLLLLDEEEIKADVRAIDFLSN
jgi:5-methylthioadenosine/S-adenosylhomocysteine deaminase